MRTISVVPEGLDLGGEILPLHSGEIHYLRHDPQHWPLLLDRVVEMGFRVICTYIPWSIHEITCGRFDFEQDEKDVTSFLKLCHARGLKVMVRPGPHINAEMTYFGYPKRLFADDALLAKTAQGTNAVYLAFPKPFPSLSYAAEGFWQEVALFFDALAPLLTANQHPDGPIVAVQLDNEFGFMFRPNAYDQDYSTDSIAQYRRYLAQRYGDIAVLNQAYGTSLASFDELEPPRRFDARAGGPALLLRLGTLQGNLHQRCLRAFTRHVGGTRSLQRGLDENYYWDYPLSAFDLAGAERRLDIGGVDMYAYKEDYAKVKRTAAYMHGTSRYPFIPEFGVGAWIQTKTFLPQDVQASYFASLMHGVKGFNHYMLAERGAGWVLLSCATGGCGRNFSSFFKRSTGCCANIIWPLYRKRAI